MSKPRPLGRRRGRAGLVLLALAVAAFGAPGASHADPDDVEDAREQAEEVRSAAEVAEARLEELGRDAGLAIERYNEIAVELERVQIQLAQELEEFDGVQRRIERRAGVASEFARQLYQHGSAFGLETMLSSQSISDMQTRAMYLRNAAESHYDLVEKLKVDRNVELTQVADLERTRAVVAARERELSSVRAEVESTLAAQADEVALLREDVAAAEQDLSAAEEAERLAREEAERAAAEEAARVAAAEAAAAQATADEAAREAAEEAADAGVELPDGPDAPPAVTTGGDAGQIAVEAALTQLGKPYVYAADGPDSYDCSGLTMWAWAHAGVSLPHSSRMQYAATARVAFEDMQPGDLMFFGSPIHHVAMYIGGGDSIEAPYTGSQVRINPETIYRDDMVGIGRP